MTNSDPMNIDYDFDHVGGCLISCSDGRNTYLQGEDADPIRELDEWLDNTEFPHGPWLTMQEAINEILSDYIFDECDV